MKITVTYSSYRWCASFASSTPVATAWIPSASAVFRPSGRRVLSRAEDSAAAGTMKTGRQRPSEDPASTRCLAAGDMGPAADSAAAAGEEVTAVVVLAAAVGVSVAAAVVSAAGMAAAAEVGAPGEDLAAGLEAAVAAVEDLEEAGAAEWDSAEANPTELLPVMFHQSICKLGNSLSV